MELGRVLQIDDAVVLEMRAELVDAGGVDARLQDGAAAGIDQHRRRAVRPRVNRAGAGPPRRCHNRLP